MTELCKDKSYGSHSCAKTGEQEAGPDASTGPTYVTVFGCEPPVSARGGSSRATGEKNQDPDDSLRKKRRTGPSPKSAASSGQGKKDHQRKPTTNGPLNMNIGTSKNTWSRYLVVEAVNADNPLSKLSPWAIEKGFEEISSYITNIKKMKTGAFLIECPDPRVSRLALARNGTVFVDRRIKVTPHRSLNTSRGVIRCDDEGLSLMAVEDIEKQLESQGVTKVQPVTKRNGTKVQTYTTYFLTFATPSPPETLKVGWFWEDVEPYVPKPMQCYNCMRFGHPKAKCKARPVCRLCGGEAHEGSCPHPAKCGNCKGPHAPTSRNCPMFKKEELILKIRTEKKISFAQAKKEVEALDSKKSYADVAAPPNGQQTEANSVVVSTRSIKSTTMQHGPTLPEAILAEAAANGKWLKEELKKRKTASAKPRQRDQGMSHPPNGSPAPGPASKATGAKRGKRPAPRAQSPDSNSRSQSAPPSRTKSGRPPTPAPAHQAAGKEQAKEPAPPDIQMEKHPTSAEKPEESSASAPKAAEVKQAKTPASENAPEKPSAPIKKGADAEQASGPASVEVVEVEMEATSHNSPIKGDAGAQASVLQSPGGLPFEAKRSMFASEDSNFKVPQKSKSSRAWRRSPSQQGRLKKPERCLILSNRFYPFEDPENPESGPEEG